MSIMIKGYFEEKADQKSNKNNTNMSNSLIPTQKELELEYKGIKIKKRNDGRWYARIPLLKKYKYIYDVNQERCLVKLKKFIETNKKLTKFQTIPNKKPNSITYNQWIEKWFELYKINKVKPNTIKAYKSVIKNYISNGIGKNEIKKITSIDLLELINKVASQYGRTTQKLYDILKETFVKAYNNKIIDEDITLLLEKPKHTKKITPILTLEQEQLFINECKKYNDQISDYILLLLYQGMRHSEPWCLRQDDLDFNNNTITLKERLEEKQYLKTAKSNRTMPMFNNSREILIKYKDKQVTFKFANKLLDNRFNEIRTTLGLKNITTHSLRHTFITRAKEKGVAEHILQSWVGHEIGSKMTSSIYTHIDKTFENKCVDLMNIN